MSSISSINCFDCPSVTTQKGVETTGSVASAPNSPLFDFAAKSKNAETTGSIASLFGNDTKAKAATTEKSNNLFANNNQNTETTGSVASINPSGSGASAGSGSGSSGFSMVA